jgi:FtsH-binding integral membrane protein
MPAPYYFHHRVDLAGQLSRDLRSMPLLIGLVLAGLLMVLAGVRILPVEATPLSAKVLCLLALTLSTAAVGAYTGRRIRGWLPMIGLLLLSIGGILVVRAAGEGPLAIGLLIGWGFLNGMMLGPLVALAISEQGPGIVLQSLTGTTAVMLLLGALSTITDLDLDSLASVLFVALIGLLVFGLVRIFVRFSRTVNLLYSVIGMVVFSGFFLFHFFRLGRSENTWERAIDLTISLYLTFSNFFAFLLQFLLGSRRR